ncbi:MAG TPA: ATP-binding protein [Myxococcota bacterium]|nr:ATP-binding protein [Myxococcota bacterium]HNH45636.1 ATP-binding protein [Myxococcota bacterium]
MEKARLSALQRYSGYRLLVGLGVLAVTSAYSGLGGVSFRQLLPYFEISLAALLIFLLTQVWYDRRPAKALDLYGQVALDVFGVSMLVYLSGSGSSLVAFLYFPVIAASPFLIPGAAALWTGLMASVGYALTVWALGPTNLVLLVYELVLRLLAFFLVALIMDSYVRRYRRLEVEHATVLDQVRAGVLSTDAQERVRDMNPAAKQMMGGVLGMTLGELFPRRGGGATWEEQRGIKVYVCSQAPLPQGGWVVVMDDVTELYRAREKSLRQERFAAVGRLAASVAHEIRNPLASMSGYLQMLAEDVDNRLAHLALEDARRLNRLVEDFLQTARAPVLRRSYQDLAELARDVVEAFRLDPRGAAVQVELITLPSPAKIDPDRIRQVLVNLLSNAAQAMPSGGTVQLQVQPSMAVEGVPEGVDIWVRDEGVGVAREDLRRIFDPFYTTRAGGTGLGLAVVEQILSGHGGHVTASRRPERGMAFHLWLPMEAPDMPSELPVELLNGR